MMAKTPVITRVMMVMIAKTSVVIIRVMMVTMVMMVHPPQGDLARHGLGFPAGGEGRKTPLETKWPHMLLQI